MDFGYATEKCHKYAQPLDQCKTECFEKEEEVWYAKDWGYVGGFFGKCSEARLMKEILTSGPASVAIDVQNEFMTFNEPKSLNHRSPTNGVDVLAVDVHL